MYATRRSCTLSHFSNANLEKFLMTAKASKLHSTIEVFRLENYRNIAILWKCFTYSFEAEKQGDFLIYFLLFFKKNHWRGGLKVTRAETGNYFFFLAQGRLFWLWQAERKKEDVKKTVLMKICRWLGTERQKLRWREGIQKTGKRQEYRTRESSMN